MKARWSIGVTLAVLAALTTSSCSPPPSPIPPGDPNGYATITERNKLCGFSFEYRTYYETEGVDRNLIDYSIPGVAVYFLAPSEPLSMLMPGSSAAPRTVAGSMVPAHIEFRVYDPRGRDGAAGVAPPDDRDSSMRLAHDLRSQGTSKNFKLLERTTANVSGIEAQIIYYQVDSYEFAPKGSYPRLRYIRAAYWDDGGLIWMLTATSVASSEDALVDQTNADFEHILQTFKILK